MRRWLVPALTGALCLAAIAAITVLQGQNADDRDAELSLAEARAALTQLQSAPYGALALDEADPQFARQETRFAREEMAQGEDAVNATMAELRAGSPPAELGEVIPLLRENYAVIDRIFELRSTVGPDVGIDRLGQRAGRLSGQIDSLLADAAAEYHDRAEGSAMRSTVGAAVMIALLFAAFALFLTRSDRLQREKEELLAASRVEALTDPLTGLGNRRALIDDLERTVPAATSEDEAVLALFDLNGFKQYNDTFGHSAGDALLTRLGVRLADAVEGAGTAYRMGGDEFCVLARLNGGGGEAVQRASEALSESGEVFDVGCAYGSVVIPTEVATSTDALRVSDQRMYENKSAGRVSATRESTDVLLKVLDERSKDLLTHARDVAELAVLTGTELGVGDSELSRLFSAGELHDVGKSAIPEAVLNKPGPLTTEEWAFIHQHTLIGERIVLAAHSLAPIAELVRSSHERVDGGGYPDGLRGEQIPLGARIIAVCDAYDAMLMDRPYSGARSHDDALAELRRSAGSQFDPAVVDAFIAAIARRAAGNVDVSAIVAGPSRRRAHRA